MEQVYTVDQVKSILNTSESMVLKLLRSGELKGFRLGTKNWRVSESSLEQFLRDKEKETAAAIAEVSDITEGNLNVDSYDEYCQEEFRERIRDEIECAREDGTLIIEETGDDQHTEN